MITLSLLRRLEVIGLSRFTNVLQMFENSRLNINREFYFTRWKGFEI